MRFLVDANIMFSALYDMDSNAGLLLLSAIDGEDELFSTDHVRFEMRDILTRKLAYSKAEADSAVEALPVKWLEREIYADELAKALKALHDEADASLLAAASLMGCEVIAGDKRILSARFGKVKVRKLKDAVVNGK